MKKLIINTTEETILLTDLKPNHIVAYKRTNAKGLFSYCMLVWAGNRYGFDEIARPVDGLSFQSNDKYSSIREAVLSGKDIEVFDSSEEFAQAILDLNKPKDDKKEETIYVLDQRGSI